MTPYPPTRRHPHRICRAAHPAGFLLGIILFAQLILDGLSFPDLVCCFVAAFLGYAIARAVNGKSTGELQAEEGAGTVLVARPVWTAIAAGCDLLFLLAVTAQVAVELSGSMSSTAQLDSASVMSSIVGIAIGLSIGLSVVFLDVYSHQKATRPATPKYSPVTAEGTA